MELFSIFKCELTILDLLFTLINNKFKPSTTTNLL